MKPVYSKSVIPPKKTAKVQMRCLNCGCVFRGIRLLTYQKCPNCGSRKTKRDERVLY